MQGWLNIFKSVSVIHHLNKMKDKKSYDHLRGRRKHLTKSIIYIYDKNSQQSRYRGNIPQQNKRHIWQAHCWNHTQQCKAETFSSHIRNKARMLTLTTSIVLDVLARATGQENKIKDIHIGMEEVKLLRFVEDMILNVENSKASIKKLLELIKWIQ